MKRFWTIVKPIYEELKDKEYSENKAREMACYNSADLRMNFSDKEIQKFDYWDCSGIKTLETDKKEVSFISSHERTLSKTGTNYNVRAHFRLKNNKNVSYSSEDKHTTAQHILAALILQDEPIKIDYRDIPFRLNDINLIKKDKTKKHILEESRIDNEFDINRRADLLFELEEPNLTFGKGIVFEITNSEGLKSIKEKSKDWAKIGYSLVTIDISNFDFDNFSLKDDNYLIMYRLFDDINFYFELLEKIKRNRPLINNFNKEAKRMEKRLYLWKNGNHKYNLDNLNEKKKCKRILLYCHDIDVKETKNRNMLILRCHDFSNKAIDVINWFDKSTIMRPQEKEAIKKYKKNIIEIRDALLKKWENKININLGKFSKIRTINISKEEQKDGKED